MPDIQRYERFVYYTPQDNYSALQIGIKVSNDFTKELPSLDCVVADTPTKLKEAVETSPGPLFVWFGGDVAKSHRLYENGEELPIISSKKIHPYGSMHNAIFLEGKVEENPLLTIYNQAFEYNEDFKRVTSFRDHNKIKFNELLWKTAFSSYGIAIPSDKEIERWVARAYVVSDASSPEGVLSQLRKAYANYVQQLVHESHEAGVGRGPMTHILARLQQIIHQYFGSFEDKLDESGLSEYHHRILNVMDKEFFPNLQTSPKEHALKVRKIDGEWKASLL